jgi:hypothetical protein
MLAGVVNAPVAAGADRTWRCARAGGAGDPPDAASGFITERQARSVRPRG